MKNLLTLLTVLTFCLSGFAQQNYAGGDGSENNPFQIATAEQLAFLAEQTNTGTGGDAHYLLIDDIHLDAETNWNSIGYFEKDGNDSILFPFTGVFDGNSHKIYGLYQEFEDEYLCFGLFGYIHNAEIRNTTIVNCNITCNSQHEYSKVGGLIGVARKSIIENCHIDEGTITINANENTGGIVSNSVQNWIASCSNRAEIHNLNGSGVIGGIAGYSQNDEITDCQNFGKLSNGNYIGGIVGLSHGGNISFCLNYGSLQGISIYSHGIGGIIGIYSLYYTQDDSYVIKNCQNFGKISVGYDSAGGILGRLAGQLSKQLFIVNCCNYGEIIDNVWGAGGILGHNNSNQSLLIMNVFNRGIVNADITPAGIIGSNDHNLILRNAYNTGEIQCDHYDERGAIVNSTNIDGIQDCYWLANEEYSGNGEGSELLKSCAFNATASATGWQLDSLRYGTNDLLDALNAGVDAIMQDYPELGQLSHWTEDIFFINDGYPILEDQKSAIWANHAEWYYEIQNDNGSITYQQLQQEGDTVIEHKDVKIIVRTNTLYDKHQEITHEYVYEENNVVYWWNKTLNEFTTLYDFAAETGDEWQIKVGTETITLHVDAVEPVEYDGRTYKVMNVSDEGDLFSGNIVCGIGHVASLFPEKLMQKALPFDVESLRCYWVNDDLILHMGTVDCDEILAVEENVSAQDSESIALYPNPTNGTLYIENQGYASTFSISNMLGQTVMTGNIADSQTIDVSGLDDGMYFICIGQRTVKFAVRK